MKWLHSFAPMLLASLLLQLVVVMASSEMALVQGNKENQEHGANQQRYLQDDDLWAIGTRVFKEFDDGWYVGVITEYDDIAEVYEVLYEDQEGETYDWDSQELEDIVTAAAEYDPWEQGTEVYNEETGLSGVIEGFENWKYIIKWESGETLSYPRFHEVDLFVSQASETDEPTFDGTATEEPTADGTYEGTYEDTEEGSYEGTYEDTEEGSYEGTYEDTEEGSYEGTYEDTEDGTFEGTSAEPLVAKSGGISPLRSSMGGESGQESEGPSPVMLTLIAGVCLTAVALFLVRKRRVSQQNRMETLVEEYKDSLELPEIQ